MFLRRLRSQLKCLEFGQSQQLNEFREQSVPPLDCLQRGGRRRYGENKYKIAHVMCMVSQVENKIIVSDPYWVIFTAFVIGNPNYLRTLIVKLFRLVYMDEVQSLRSVILC